jgi:hypothetical protein
MPRQTSATRKYRPFADGLSERVKPTLSTVQVRSDSGPECSQKRPFRTSVRPSVAIPNSPHIVLDEAGVTFKYPGVMLENGTLASILAMEF